MSFSGDNLREKIICARLFIFAGSRSWDEKTLNCSKEIQITGERKNKKIESFPGKQQCLLGKPYS
jgi:hypothetical protein